MKSNQLHFKETMQRDYKRIVSIGIQFDRFGEIDTMNEKYQADIKIVATWEDDKMFDKYNEDIHWNPELSIENIITETKKTTKYAVEKNYRTNRTKVTQIQNIKGIELIF